MNQKSTIELSGKPAVLAVRDSLLLNALLLDAYLKDTSLKERIATAVNMLAMENQRLLREAMAPVERETLLAEGVSAAHTLLKELPTLRYRLPGQKLPNGA
jgi:hypothetical protein